SVRPTKPNNKPVNICVTYTKNFLVLYNSKNGPQNGFNVHGSIIKDVQKAICASDTPKFLYMIELAPDRATNGNPIANQVVGIHDIGWIDFLEFTFFTA